MVCGVSCCGGLRCVAIWCCLFGCSGGCWLVGVFALDCGLLSQGLSAVQIYGSNGM